MRSAITVSLVPEAKGGPFVFWDGLEDAFTQASVHGFDAVEIFPSSSEALSIPEVQALQQKTGLSVAAVGTGAGWVKHKLHLCHPDETIRKAAKAFIASVIRCAAALNAPTILGSMQGRVEAGVERSQALDWLSEALAEAGALAAS
ncbi:MAG: TIM barrel protein, partial [Verrucomicrobiota bacterium]